MLQSDAQADLLHAQERGDTQAEAVAIRRLLRRGPIDPMTRFYGKLAFGLSDCWYWRGAVNRLGYGLLPMFGESKAHRVSWVLHNGPIPEGMMVLHKCDVRCCVNPAHLFLGTQTDNMRDMAAKGRGVSVPRFGEANSRSRLTSEQVREIRAAYAGGGLTMKAIAKVYGVAAMTIQRVIARTSWRHQ